MTTSIRHAFAALEAFNKYEALRISEVARVLDLPRTTTVRAVRALVSMGYVARRADDSRYCITARVQALASGYGEVDAFITAVRGIADEVCREMRWPVTIAVPHGFALRVAYSTDTQTPHKLFTSPAGTDLPVRESASGMVYLAYCDEATRSLLLSTPPDSGVPSKFHRTDAELQAAILSVQNTGSYFQDHSFVWSKQFDGYQTKECILAVPVLVDKRIVAVLSSRMLTRAVRRAWIDGAMLPRLVAAAADMAETFCPIGRGAGATRAPHQEPPVAAGRRGRASAALSALPSAPG